MEMSEAQEVDCVMLVAKEERTEVQRVVFAAQVWSRRRVVRSTDLRVWKKEFEFFRWY